MNFKRYVVAILFAGGIALYANAMEEVKLIRRPMGIQGGILNYKRLGDREAQALTDNTVRVVDIKSGMPGPGTVLFTMMPPANKNNGVVGLNLDGNILKVLYDQGQEISVDMASTPIRRVGIFEDPIRARLYKLRAGLIKLEPRTTGVIKTATNAYHRAELYGDGRLIVQNQPGKKQMWWVFPADPRNPVADIKLSANDELEVLRKDGHFVRYDLSKGSDVEVSKGFNWSQYHLAELEDRLRRNEYEDRMRQEQLERLKQYEAKKAEAAK